MYSLQIRNWYARFAIQLNLRSGGDLSAILSGPKWSFLEYILHQFCHFSREPQIFALSIFGANSFAKKRNMNTEEFCGEIVSKE